MNNKTQNDVMTVRSLLSGMMTGALALTVISCGGGKRAGAPPASGNAILPSAPKLNPPTVVFPPTTQHPSNSETLVITGTCTPGPGAKVFLGGDDNQQTSCGADGTFSFNVTKNNDGTFNYTLREESLVEHPSDATSFTWTRSTTPPNPPVVTSANPNQSTATSATITGTCVAASTVNLTGAATQSTTCSAGGGFSFTITQSTDGTFQYSLTQTDPYGNQSTSIPYNWIRQAAQPTAPVVTTPVSSPYTSGDSTLTLAGTCENGTTVNLSGRTTASTGCTGSVFSFDLAESTNGTYNYSLVAVSSGGVSSTTTSFQWIRNAGVPATPILTSPNSTPVSNNSDNLLIAGSCDTGNTVFLTGSSTNSTTCAASAFSFNVNKTSDATYTFSVYQQDGSAVNSGATGVTWTRDTLPPIAPIVTAPGITPYYSSSTNLLISGVCEAGSTVTLTGDATNMVACLGTNFSLSISKTTNATYNFTVSQTDVAGNTSSGTSVQWHLDTVAPAVPSISTPASTPITSNASSFTISGTCEASATVYLTGGSTQNTPCSANTFSFTINQSTDGTYDFTLYQTDLAGLNSSSTSVRWIRDTVAPSAPTISNPASNPLTSNDTNLTLSGSCESGSTILYSGDASGSTSCASSAYSFGISKSVDGTYNFSITQRDAANNTSSAAAFQWVRLSSIPSTPTITTPSSNPHHGKLTTITLGGACTTGNTVQLSGAGSQSTSCSANSYSFSLTQGSDGTYNYSIVQINGASVSSGAATFTWYLDTTSPANPVVTSPASSPTTNSASSLPISGTCEANATISYGGSATGTTTCSAGGTFSFTPTSSSDGTFTYTISQTDQAGNSSGTSQRTWIRDTLAPATPTLTQPNMNPYTSGDTNLTIGGGCELNASLALSGAASQTTSCSGLGTYSFSVSNTVDGTYTYSVTQTDVAGNSSSALNFQWIRDTTIPFTPVVTSPASTSYSSNGSTLSVSVSCQTGLTPTAGIVHLSGVLDTEVVTPATMLDQDCTTSPVTYVIQKNTDGVYALTFNQENPNNTAVSADSVLTWTRDTIAPSAPTITAPASSPYTGPGNITLAGGCENGATVNLTGDSTQSQSCASGAYSFSIIKSVDATYNFSITQTDIAGNASTARTQQWIRNSDSLPPPTIATPTPNPYSSNGSSVIVSGTCQPSYTVTLGGDVSASDVSSPLGSLTQTCSGGGAYSFTINKSTDGTYVFNLTESFAAATSSAVSVTWIRDTLAPTATINTMASNPNLTTSITFTLSAGETSTYQCKLGTGSYQSCSSPVTYTGLTNGASTISVIATDTTGNIGTATTYNWTQSAYNAVALYHLNAGTGSALNDSGLFTSSGTYTNHLTSYGTPATNTNGKLPTSAPKSFTLGTSKYFDVAYNASFGSVKNTMTFEGLYSFSALPTAGNYFTLASQTGSAAPNLGWEIRLLKPASGAACASSYVLTFVASLDGNTQSSVNSPTCISVSTGSTRWYYTVVTWNSGTINFYMSRTSFTSKGSGTIGTPGSATLFIPNVPFKIGANSTSGTGTSKWLTGSVDAVRISNTVRTGLAYPTAEATAD